MEDIKPSKIIVNPSELKDNADTRAGYDSRLIPPDQLPESLTYLRLFSYFNVPMEEREQMTGKLKLLNEWARRKGGSYSEQDVYKSLRWLENRMGIPPIGLDRIDYLYQYAKIDNQSDELERERERLTNAASRRV